MESSQQSTNSTGLQRAGIISREQLLTFLNVACSCFDQPEIRSQIKEGVKDGKSARDMAAAVKAGIFQAIGIEPSFGLASLSAVTRHYAEDREVVLKFCNYNSREESACDEAELTTLAFAQKRMNQQVMQQQQLAFLVASRGLTQEEQRGFYQKVFFEVKKLQEERLLTGEAAVSTREVWEFVHKEFEDLKNPRS